MIRIIFMQCRRTIESIIEITRLLKTFGHKKIDLFGVKPGSYSRNNKFTSEDLEMPAVAEKQEDDNGFGKIKNS